MWLRDQIPACRRIASALAIGCVYRSKGGIALLGMVNYVAETLIAVARASSGISHIWLLHSLWLVATSAGLSFMPNVKACHLLFSTYILLQTLNLPTEHCAILDAKASCKGLAYGAVLAVLRFQGARLTIILQEVLNLETELLMSEEADAVPGLRPVLGRLANAMVAVLGPEMTLGSASYTKTRTLLLDLQASILACSNEPCVSGMGDLHRDYLHSV